jgi:ABC-type nitrate/sulfonate/bicarbonate transport system permease component
VKHKVTWGTVFHIFWAILWRQLLIGIGVGLLFGIPLGLIMGARGT